MIPIIVRNGDLPAQAGIVNVQLVKSQGRPAIQFGLTRSGERSLYGGIDVYLIGQGGEKKLAGIKGVGVYGEIDERKMTIPLDPKSPAIAPGSRVKIVYTDDELNPGKVLAETEATLS